MNTPQQAQQQPQAQEDSFSLDLDSDEPMVACPMRKDGMAPGEICEACQ